MTTATDFIHELTLIGGVGDYDEKRACIMSACVAKWRLEHGEPLGDATDDLECVCPVVRRFAIRVNDAKWWKDDAERTEVLMPFVDKILNTKDATKTMKRGYMCADSLVREITPRAFDVAGWAEEAAKLRALSPIVDAETASAATIPAREARDFAFDRRKAAYAYTDAVAYAYAAAVAAADAYTYAYAAADAYADAVAAADAAAVAAADADAAAAAAAAADADARANALAFLTKLCEVE